MDQRFLQSNQAHLCPHSSTKAWGAVATSHHAQKLVPAQPACRCDIFLCTPRSVCPAHGSYLSPGLWGLLCGWHKRHCRAWTGQHSKERIHPRKTTLSRIQNKIKQNQHIREKRTWKTIIFPSVRSTGHIHLASGWQDTAFVECFQTIYQETDQHLVSGFRLRD